MRREARVGRLRNQHGTLTLVEIMVAAVVLLLILWGASNYFSRGRHQVGEEEARRKATAAAQLRLDQLRAYHYGALPAYNGTDTTIVMGNETYKVAMAVTAASPNLNATTLVATVTWRMHVNANPVADTRTAQATTIVGRITRK